jgi:hypothetical protein
MPLSPSTWSWLLGATLALLLVQTLRLRWWRTRSRMRRRRRALRARDGERAAAELLSSLGHRVVEHQPERVWRVEVDGDAHDVQLRADYLTRRGGRAYVAEVKTGARAPSIETAATRRQLLEYRLAYDVDGILLVDMEAGSVREVGFPLVPERVRRSQSNAWPAIVLALLATALLALALRS